MTGPGHLDHPLPLSATSSAPCPNQPEDLRGKYIILDVLARDGAGHCYNVEIQVRRYGAWHQRGLYYLARILGQQLGQSEDYNQLRAAVGIHLLDFDLFAATDTQRAQAIWRFEMRDERQPEVTLGNVLQLNLIELRKADRLGLAPSPLAAWVTFFEHWREEQTMATIEHAPIQEALSRVRHLSADEEAQRLAFVRERALRDELSFLKEAREEGLQQGLEQGLQQGLQQGLEAGQRQAARETACNLIRLGLLDEEQIATATGLTLDEVQRLRADAAH